MAEQMYEVIVEKYVGKHRIYKKGAKIAATEIMGGDAGKKLALEGQKGKKNKRQQALKDVPPSLKIAAKDKK